MIEAKTAELVDGAQAELDEVLAIGGAFEAIDELKGRLVAHQHRAHASHRVRRAQGRRRQRVHRDRPSPLDGDDDILKVDPAIAEAAAAADRVAGRPRRRRRAARARRAASGGRQART